MVMQVLRIEAIQKEVNGVTVYTGWVEGKKVRNIAKIVHITREGEYIQGYQRSEIPKHIAGITDYVESTNATILANLVVGFDKTVTFEPITNGSSFGHLLVPYDPELPSDLLPGAIVDGQQRSGGVKNSFHESYPLPISVFISEDEKDYIQQFLILNLGRPLTNVQLNALALYDDIYKPPALAEKAFPLSMSEELGFRNHNSPLHGLIKSNGNKEGLIAESSITEFISNVERQVLSVIGVRVYQDLTPETRLLFSKVVVNFWHAVTDVFSDDWNKKSRNMSNTYIIHGSAIIAFSFLCRHMIREFKKLSSGIPSVEFFKSELEIITEYCHFSAGTWKLGIIKNDDYPENSNDEYLSNNRRWNDFQNTTSEKQLLATHVLKVYEIQKGYKKVYPFVFK